MKRRETRWNGEGPEGTERLDGAERLKGMDRDQMERRGIRWNRGAQDGTEGDQIELRWTRRNGKTRRNRET